MTDDGDDIRDIRLMVMGESTYPGAVWRESVRDLLSEIDRLTAERDALREAVDEMNITALIAHALEDGHIDEDVTELFEEALNDQNAALAALKDT